MKRRDFFRNSSLSLIGASVLNPFGKRQTDLSSLKGKNAKNIIFMVSDGMSTGTLNMADLLLQRKEGRRSHWMKLYDERKGIRALMDTSSANSLVTDSAAGSSAWGGGVKVPNGSLNVNADGSFNKPILQKFKAAGKSVGCVTSVPVTHATPAGFSVNNKSRGDQAEIALQYLDLRFDVMLGGGREYFDKTKRADKRDLLTDYRNSGFEVAENRQELLGKTAAAGKPLLGVFSEGGLPYALDLANDAGLREQIPTLAEMTSVALQRLSRNPKGFVMQIEGGKVDWAAHANDIGGLLYDQVAFDDAIKVAVEFAEREGDTLLIITTDHGNANPGLFSDKNFELLANLRHTNDYVLRSVRADFTADRLTGLVEAAQGYALKKEDAERLLSHFVKHGENGLYNPDKLPLNQFGAIQTPYLGVGWAGNGHSADFVELTAYGPGSELLGPFVKNSDLHQLMLQAAAVQV